MMPGVYPGVREQLAVGEYLETPVVVDGMVITSRGAGTALAFALALVTHFVDAQKAHALAASIVATV